MQIVVDFRAARTTKGHDNSTVEDAMLRRLMHSSPRGLAKWCLYAVALLAPGSLAVLVVVWLVRLWTGRNFKGSI